MWNIIVKVLGTKGEDGTRGIKMDSPRFSVIFPDLIFVSKVSGYILFLFYFFLRIFTIESIVAHFCCFEKFGFKKFE